MRQGCLPLFNHRNDFINMVERFAKPKEDMLARLCLPQVKFGAELHYFLTVL